MNNQNSILLVDPQFDPITAGNCSLLVKIGIDTFSYGIINKELNKVVAVYDEQEVLDISLKLSERINKDPYLSLPFNEVKLAVSTENNIQVPHEFYLNEALNLHTKFFQQIPTGHIYSSSQPNFNFTSVFSFPPKIDGMINESFKNSKKYEQHAALLKLAENNTDNALFIDFTSRSMNVLYLAAKNVVFQQCFETETVEEFNYYLLLVTRQLMIDFKDTSLYISGIIDQEDKKYTCLKKYFDDISFLNFVDDNLDQQVLEDMPAHYYATLLALDQCVS